MSVASRFPLAGLALTTLMASLDTSIANAALPVLATAFGASFQAVRWVVLAYLLTLTVFALIAGRLGDVVGRRRFLLSGTALFTVASVICGLAPNLPVLLAARAAQGLGAAAMMSLTVALVGDSVSRAKTGRAMGLLGTMSALGTTLGPTLGGMLTARFGWPAIFLVNMPLGALSLLLIGRGLPADQPRPDDKSSRPDARPAVVLVRTPPVAASLAAILLVMTVLMTTLVVGPFYLSSGLGLGVRATGLALSLGPMVAAGVGVPAGRLVDRFGVRAMTLAGLAAVGGGAAAIGALPRSAGATGYLASIAAMTAGYALFQAANNAFLMTTVDPRHRGAAAGLLGLARNLGLIAGTSAMGAVFAWAAGSAGAAVVSAGALADAVRVTFRVATLLIGGAVAIAAWGGVFARSVSCVSSRSLSLTPSKGNDHVR